MIKTTLIPGIIDVENDIDEFGKNIRLIEYAVENPLYVLHTIFDGWGPDETRDWCRDWFYMAIAEKSPHYNDEKEIFQLTRFYRQLMFVLEALYIYMEIEEPSGKQIKYKKYLTAKQVANPLKVLDSFYNDFPIYYIHRELYDWLFAGVLNTGIYLPTFSEADALITYHRVSSLLEAGWYLYLKQVKKAKKLQI